MIPLQQNAFPFDKPRPEVSNVGEFSTTDVNGNPFDQSMFKDYDLTLVNIFTTWCSPCVNELPELEKLYQEVSKEYNVGVAGIVMDTVDENFEQTDDTAESLEKAKLLAEKTGCTFPFLIPDKTAMNGRLIGIDGFPETFFVDRDGNIVGGTYPGSRSYEEWSETVKAELENLNK